MRPPAIHQVFQICPEDAIVLVFGDESIYLYTDFRTPVETVIAAFIHGRKFNAPGFRRPKYPRFTAPYEKLEEIPEDALLVYAEPPYRATEEPATCPTLPDVLFWPAEMQTWADAEHDANNGGPCALVELTQDDPDNYTGGTCIGPAFLSNFGSFWNLSLNVGVSVVFRSTGTNVLGPYNHFSGFTQVTPPANWFFETS